MNRVLKAASARKLGPLEARRRLVSSCVHPTVSTALAMKPGTPILGLNFIKGKDPPVAIERGEYPDWVSDLAKPRKTLAMLRRLPLEESSDADQMRYLKLTRRTRIKKGNVEAGA